MDAVGTCDSCGDLAVEVVARPPDLPHPAAWDQEEKVEVLDDGRALVLPVPHQLPAPAPRLTPRAAARGPAQLTMGPVVVVVGAVVVVVDVDVVLWSSSSATVVEVELEVLDVVVDDVAAVVVVWSSELVEDPCPGTRSARGTVPASTPSVADAHELPPDLRGEAAAGHAAQAVVRGSPTSRRPSSGTVPSGSGSA